ncbi:MAG: hypothetical protein DI551_01235 [Micavibrio aeruginosavorus]|uniref:HNH endonuclease n=1 Tax=Micavibrio aeruginosavorus TaxID=349221 RepID=A0A2W5N583_9BACT|nr:MAG: hypothetical protein DI551_01235 [Micavibrio aeruginosavorus]
MYAPVPTEDLQALKKALYKAFRTHEAGVLSKYQRSSRDNRRKATFASRANAVLFDAVLSNLPPCLELSSHTLVQAPTEERQHLRQDFNKSVRRSLIQEIFANSTHHEALQRMGIAPAHITQIAAQGQIPKEFYDATLDHIIPLIVGGANDPANLTLIPNYLNTFRAVFFHAQKEAAAKAGLDKVLTFIPRKINGRVPMVPLIPRGFRPGFRNHPEASSMQVNQLFAAKIL